MDRTMREDQNIKGLQRIEKLDIPQFEFSMGGLWVTIKRNLLATPKLPLNIPNNGIY